MNTDIHSRSKKIILRKASLTLWLLLTLALLSTSGYFYYQYQKLARSPLAAQVSAQEEAEKLTMAVGKLMLLPKDETPTVATVTDIDKIKDQPFFKDAQNDHKVLIYPNTKLAIIYDPKANLIVNVGPINFHQSPTQSVQSTRVGLRNGTSVTGLTFKVESELKKTYPDINIVKKDQSTRTDYQKTVIVLLNDASSDTAEALAKSLNSPLEKLPEGEVKPDGVDILVILGTDKS